MNAKILSQEGNSPDYSLRSPKVIKWKNRKKFQTIWRQAWKQPFFKESVIAHRFRFFAFKMYRD